jgi:hypothetical protein
VHWSDQVLGYAAIGQAIADFQAALTERRPLKRAFLQRWLRRTAYDGVNEYYPTEKGYIFALAEALRQEYLKIYKAGLLV